MKKAAILCISSIAFAGALYSAVHLARAAESCSMETLGKQKVLLVNLYGRASQRLEAIRSEIANTQSSDAKVLIKRLSASSRAAAKCIRQLRQGQPADKKICAMQQEASAYYRGRLNEIATHIPDEDTQPWLNRLRLLETDYNNQLNRLGNQVSATNSRIEACRSQQNADESEKKPCRSSIIGTWDWWDGSTVTFHVGGVATHSAGSQGEWDMSGPRSGHVHWDTFKTDDFFRLSPDGTELIGTYNGQHGVSKRSC